MSLSSQQTAKAALSSPCLQEAREKQPEPFEKHRNMDMLNEKSRSNCNSNLLYTVNLKQVVGTITYYWKGSASGRNLFETPSVVIHTILTTFIKKI